MVRQSSIHTLSSELGSFRFLPHIYYLIPANRRFDDASK
jgi:hypothetical protein